MDYPSVCGTGPDFSLHRRSDLSLGLCGFRADTCGPARVTCAQAEWAKMGGVLGNAPRPRLRSGEQLELDDFRENEAKVKNPTADSRHHWGHRLSCAVFSSLLSTAVFRNCNSGKDLEREMGMGGRAWREVEPVTWQQKFSLFVGGVNLEKSLRRGDPSSHLHSVRTHRHASLGPSSIKII